MAHLLSTIGELEAEVEALHDAMTEQQLYILDGYIVAIQAGTDVPFIAYCPTLRANTQGNTFEEALSGLREAMQVAIEGRAHFGHPLPPKDTEARCLD